MKYLLFVDVSVPDTIRPALTVKRRNFLSYLLQLHNKRYIVRSIACCKCGRPLLFITSKHRTYVDGHFCAVCSFQDIPGL